MPARLADDPIRARRNRPEVSRLPLPALPDFRRQTQKDLCKARTAAQHASARPFVWLRRVLNDRKFSARIVFCIFLSHKPASSTSSWTSQPANRTGCTCTLLNKGGDKPFSLLSQGHKFRASALFLCVKKPIVHSNHVTRKTTISTSDTDKAILLSIYE